MRTTRSEPLAPALSRTYAIVGLSTMPENTDAAHRRLPCARGLAPAAWLSEMSSPPYFDAYSEPLANTPAVPVHNGAYTHPISVCSERKQIRPFRSTSLSNCETTYKTARPAVLPPAEAAPFGRHGQPLSASVASRHVGRLLFRRVWQREMRMHRSGHIVAARRESLKL